VSVLKLLDGVIYGPISSRRFGPSLGINLMPAGKKACSFDCVYCHFGWTNLHSCEAEAFARFLPTVLQVGTALVDAIEELLEGGSPPNVITFSGNGEPTLHPRFGEIVAAVMLIRDRMIPEAKVQVLSNSTMLDSSDVIESLRRLDRRVMKLDVGAEELFTRVNKPVEGLSLNQIVEGLRTLGDVVIQAAFLSGEGGLDNSTDEAVAAWIERLKRIGPSEVQIYTIDRPPADSLLERVPKQRLEEIAELVRAAGFDANVY
jgi:wyosine [tRNA(Phe)-imidazoG37] synthetase (radical SAM superfamily)